MLQDYDNQGRAEGAAYPKHAFAIAIQKTIQKDMSFAATNSPTGRTRCSRAWLTCPILIGFRQQGSAEGGILPIFWERDKSTVIMGIKHIGRKGTQSRNLLCQGCGTVAAA